MTLKAFSNLFHLIESISLILSGLIGYTLKSYSQNNPFDLQVLYFGLGSGSFDNSILIN
ncbi:hypothetical protein HH_1028 [Helicobacter hepaticus ATCC 51449]|uniref:Uncharacterized protein n=1 Tax=Helicobacter hepaticus (strain ATCC 51449 / 3B1) TaxID=235279 RepID=Q7VHD9_HELHP|nr:hypothetical protein HH_1028 [Helicobacter hepaticus ATCC 51449]